MHALMIVDMQNDFIKRLSAETVTGIVNQQNLLMRTFAGRGWAIYFVVTEHRADGADALRKAREENDIPAVAGTAGACSVDGLIIPAAAITVVKRKYSAFFETDADNQLAAFGGTLVIAGVNTHACVRTSAVDACQRDIDVIVAEDAVASYDDAYHRESLRYLGGRIGRVMTTAEILNRIGAKESKDAFQ